MIKTFLTILIALCFMFSCSNGDNGLTIEGEISNLSSPYVIASFNLNDTVHVDTISVNEKGEFSYFQNIDTATIFTFYFNDFNSSAIVFSEKGINKIKMKGDALLPVLIEVKGGEINEDLTIFKKENGTLLKQRTFLMIKIDHEVDSLMNPGNLISEKERVAQINSLNHELVQKVEDFIISNPDKISSVILINEFFKNNDNPESLKRVLDYLENDALNSSLANRLKTHNQKMMLSAEGTHMPYFKLKDNKDKTIQSSDFENKYLLISFLSSNGDKSKENIEILKDEYNLLDKSQIEFLTIFIDSDTLPIKSDEKDSIPWKIAIEDKSWSSDITENFNVQYTPFNILINPRGDIITRDIPVSEVKNSINKTIDAPK